jgi:hypothetical protein
MVAGTWVLKRPVTYQSMHDIRTAFREWLEKHLQSKLILLWWEKHASEMGNAVENLL